jgi:hypothetical protein
MNKANLRKLLMASTALCVNFGEESSSLCSIDDGQSGGGGAASAGGGGGGLAGLDDGDGGQAAGGGTGGSTATATGGGDGGQGGAAPNAWAQMLSAEAAGADPSHRDFAVGKGWKSPDDAIQSYRELEKVYRASDKVVVPGKDATPEQLATFHRAIGVPDKAEGYTFDLPTVKDEAGNDAQLEIDTGFFEPMKELALKNGVPATAFKGLAEGFVQWQLDQQAADISRHDTDWSAKQKEWGAEAQAKTADVLAACRFLEIDREGRAALQMALGAGKAAELLARVGGMVGEDPLRGSGGKQFGVASAAEAQAQVDAMIGDKETAAKLRAKDPTAVARYNRLNDAIAHFGQLERNRQG